jgi:hypothetical protein
VFGWVPPLQEISVLECVKFPPWGRVSAPAGVAPEVLEECLYSSKGCKHRPTLLLHWGGRPASFSAVIGTLLAALGILSAGTVTQYLA